MHRVWFTWPLHGLPGGGNTLELDGSMGVNINEIKLLNHSIHDLN